MNTRLFNKKPVLVAEISANHNGNINTAKKLISLAKKNGADAIKLQTFTPDGMTINSKKKDFKIKNGTWKNKYLWDLYNQAQTKLEWHKELFKYSKRNKILCFSTPFHEESVDFLEKLNCPIYKVASFEITDLDLIKYIASKKKPMIISTGLASEKEIEDAFKIAFKYGNKDITLLYCVSSYPAPLADFNLNNIKIMKKKYNCKIGFSDHSTDIDVTKSAIAVGAELIEKHIILSNDKNSLDAKFSYPVEKLRNLRNAIDKTYNLLGKKNFHRTKNEKNNIIFRRSIYVSKKILQGEVLTKLNIKKVRPGYGGDIKFYSRLLGKKSPMRLNSGDRFENKLIKSILRIK